MKEIKTKAIRAIEEKIETADQDTVRRRVLESAKLFKTSWIELGQSLYSVWRDKLYKNWGYNKFDIYTSKEIGIKKQTALKLLRSYFFLEKEEPEYVKKDFIEEADAARVPTYEAVNVLRLASGKKDLDKSDYISIKKGVFESGKDAREIKRDLTALIKEREELAPEDARRKRREATLKRFVSVLRSISEEAKVSKMLPDKLIKDAESLIKNLESELS